MQDVIRYVVEGCRGRATSLTNLRIHFVHRNVQYTLEIIEGNWPHPQCPRWNMFVTLRDFNGRNSTMDICKRGDECKLRRLAAEEAIKGARTDLTNYGFPLTVVSYFKYLGRVL